MRVLNVVLASILMSSFLGGILYVDYVVIDYELNTKEITEKYCINKEKPALNCHGKCYLKKQLKTQEKATTNKTIGQTFFGFFEILNSTFLNFKTKSEKSTFAKTKLMDPYLKVKIPPPRV